MRCRLSGSWRGGNCRGGWSCRSPAFCCSASPRARSAGTWSRAGLPTGPRSANTGSSPTSPWRLRSMRDPVDRARYIRARPQPPAPAGGGRRARLGRSPAVAAGAAPRSCSALVALTIVAGGFVAGPHAGLTYNTFPLMDGSWCRPAMPSCGRYAELVREYCRGPVQPPRAGHDHCRRRRCCCGWRGSGRSAAPARRSRCTRCSPPLRCKWRSASRPCCLAVPIPLAAAHQAGAVLLLTAAIVFRHALRRPRIGRRARPTI